MNTEEKRPLILISNDDGIDAPGIRSLIDFVSDMGDVWVVAPATVQSGKGHAITLDGIIKVEEVAPRNGSVVEYRCYGTPADCVKIAKNELLPRIPDICLSGINHGSNASINVIYSGTMAAVIEAGVEGIPAVGFSLCDMDWDSPMEHLREYVRLITRNALERRLPAHTVLNVNFPTGDIKGIKVCRQAATRWEKEFEKRENPRGGNYYWMVGHPICLEEGEDTDHWALSHGYVSVVPTTFDLTAHRSIEMIEAWEL